MPVQVPLKPGSLKDPEVAQLFCTKDPDSRYADLREIGHGSFGAVFFAFDTETNETVAIKKMSFSGKQASEKWADIIKEVRFLKGIKHRNVVEYRACYLKEHTCWLVMEYCIGSASDIVEVHKKPIHEYEIAAICEQALNGLLYLHELKRIHRDVKAGNILLTDAGVVKLADVGSASISCPAQSFVGTPLWMAPEVILAMDEGQYDERADIWSFGITCIELAERRPPLFNMNAMSALYHIAQNEPPTLSRPADGEKPWSGNFQNFVDQCLRKDPQQRLSTRACINHPFITSPRPATAIADLIQRSKGIVRDLDHLQYRKMRKLMYLDEQQGIGQGPASEIGSVDSHESSGKQSLRKSRPPIPAHMTAIKDRGDGNSLPTPNHAEECDYDEVTEDIMVDTKKDELNTLRRSKFSTLRTTKLIAREIEEYKQENNMYEQMVGYKRLRQQHHKELGQLEEKCRFENEALRQRLDKEYDQVTGTCQKELAKLRNQQQAELEKRLRDSDEALRKLRKQRLNMNDHQFKSFVACQKKEYKFNKDRVKLDLKNHGMSKSQYEAALKSAKSQLISAKAEAEAKFAQEQNEVIRSELHKLRLQHKIQYHALETRLLNNELNIRARQMEVLHGLLRRHHAATRDQELAHFAEYESMKKRHLETQHESETANQKEYMKKALEETKKHHAMQSKQQPRDLRTKEAQIRKQFRQTVKVQTRQFKAYQTQMLQQVPRDEHKELLSRLKDEQNRKIASLAEQYESTISKMVNEQTVKLEAWQEEDMKKLSEKLTSELETLLDYQERQKANLAAVCDRERTQLQDKIELRRAVLEQKLNDEMKSFEQEREKQLRTMHDRHSSELSELQADDYDNSRLNDTGLTGSPTASASQFSASSQSSEPSSGNTTQRSFNSTNL
ncbi:serine/threonine-protein kinase TAO3 [Aphelenchoides avenae]|nr:serine/threonine-protein kinase TAO3 [Aphelenchus avenae]